MSCPKCDKETVQDYRPFCSKLCADLDLASWFNGSYAVPSQDLEDLDEAAKAAEKNLLHPH